MIARRFDKVTILFSDGFESGDFSKWDYLTETGGTGSVVTTDPYRGTYHAKFSTDGAGDGIESVIAIKDFDPQLIFYLRSYFKLLDSPSDGVLWQILFAYSAVTGNLFWVYVTNDGGTLKWRFRYYDGGGFYPYSGLSTKTLSLDTWYAVELYIKIDPLTGEYKLFVDGEQVLAVTNVDSGSNGITRGNIQFAPEEVVAATAYYDSVVMADKRIGAFAKAIDYKPHSAL